MRASADVLFDRFGVPNIALGVDGTQVKVAKKPGADECAEGVVPQDYWNRWVLFE